MIERDYSALFATRSADDLIAVNQYGLRVSPTRYTTPIFAHGMLPDDMTIFDVCADQIALAAECVHQLAVDRGGSARSVAPIVRQQFTDLRTPQLLAVFSIHGHQEFLLTFGAHGKQATVHDGKAGVPDARGPVQPDQLWSSLRPFPQ